MARRLLRLAWLVEDKGKRAGLAGSCGSQIKTLQVAGYRNGYWKPAEEQGVVDAITASKTDLLFVAISSPKKEQFLGRYQARMKVPFAMGVGGTFDVMVGKTTRAPVWMQKAGFEWFYRFLQEPRRMFRRYFVDDMYFFVLLARAVLARFTGKAT